MNQPVLQARLTLRYAYTLVEPVHCAWILGSSHLSCTVAFAVQQPAFCLEYLAGVAGHNKPCN